VGSEPELLKNLATWTSERVGKRQYDLGQVDCFRLVLDYSRCFNNIELPVDYRGMTLDTYGDWYLQDNIRTVKIAIEYLSTYLYEIEVSRTVAGDILVLRYGTSTFFGIDGGNGKIITVFIKTGIRVIRKQHFEVIKAFTWQQRQ